MAMTNANANSKGTLRGDSRICGNMVGKSPKMQKLFRQIKRLAFHDCPVLIHGETGTGKDLVADALHQIGPRANFAYEDINCGALPEPLALSELFGHEKGAFTGAVGRKVGALERAGEGTLFLDEVAELSLGTQAALLRALECAQFRRVGGSASIFGHFRLVCATHKNLQDEIGKKRFRQDLYYRLGVVILNVPPLRKRLEDIPLLVDTFLERWGLADKYRVTDSAIEKMQHHNWPGNVRELRNVLKRSLVEVVDGVIDGRSIHLDPEEYAEETDCIAEGKGMEYDYIRIGGRSMEAIRKEVVLFELVRNYGNLSAAARCLQMPKQTLHDYCKRQEIPI